MKFETLFFLKDKVKESIIPNFSKSEENLNYPIILRSNFFDEDQNDKTNAGKYQSKIFYEKEEIQKNYFGQEYLSDADWYGVVFTCDLKGLPYYIINLDKNSNDVTSGATNPKQYVILKEHETENPLLCKIIKSCKEIELLLNCQSLDIEFAIKNEKVYLFQARKLPLSIQSVNIKSYIDKLNINSYFSIMSDWNPAEMIGILPNIESLELYKLIITNKAWSKRREEYGYKKVDQPLMVDFYGRPYIDLKLSFLSLIPATLSDNITSKLVDYYIKKIEKNPFLHDKIEFEIVHSCYAPDFQLEGFNESEVNQIKKSLIDLTNNLILNNSFKKEVSLLKKFKKNPSIDIVEFASEPFAGLARLAFIATKLLRSFFNQIEQINFINSIKTITKKIKKQSLCLPKKQFIAKYGHLRPGTYDINSPNYEDGYELYFSNIEKKIEKTSSYNLKNIDEKLRIHGYKFKTKQLESFMRNSISLREYGKFILSIGINNCLKSSKPLGKHPIGKIINLPPLICKKKDCYEYEIQSVMPNFIGTGKTKGKMIFLESADPGYDWIFTKKITGLITKFGGSNSHMSLRCYELGVPAIIGCGEELFEKWKNYEEIEIDFDSKKIIGY